MPLDLLPLAYECYVVEWEPRLSPALPVNQPVCGYPTGFL